MVKKWEKFKKTSKETFHATKEKVVDWGKNLGNKAKTWNEQRIFEKTNRKIEGKKQKTETLKEKLKKYQDKEENIKKIIEQLETQEEKNSFKEKIEKEKSQLNKRIKKNETNIAEKTQKKLEFKMKREQSIEKINTYIGEKIKKNKEAIKSTKNESNKATQELKIMDEKINEFTIDIEDLPSSSAIKKYKEIRKSLEENKVKLEKIINKLKKGQDGYEKKSQKLENKKITDVDTNKKEKKEKKEKTGNKQVQLLRRFNKANPSLDIVEPAWVTLSNREDLEKYVERTKGVETAKQLIKFLDEEKGKDIGEERVKILDDIDKRYGKIIVGLAYLIASVERMKKEIEKAGDSEEEKNAIEISLKPTEEAINNYNDAQKLQAKEVIGLLRKEGIAI